MKLMNTCSLCIFIVLNLSCNNQNKLVLNVSKPLEIKKVKIRYTCMEAGAVDRIVLMNGKIVKEIGKGYGENDFVVSYDTLSANFGHFKTNRNDINRYDVLIYKKDNKILCKFNIQGIENEYSLKIMK